MHFRTLSQGVEVTLPNGTVVKPSQVMEDQLPSEAFMINFVPDSSYVSSVVNNPKYQQYFSEKRPNNINLDLIYHSTDSLELFNNVDYLDFMSKFGSSA